MHVVMGEDMIKKFSEIIKTKFPDKISVTVKFY